MNCEYATKEIVQISQKLSLLNGFMEAKDAKAALQQKQEIIKAIESPFCDIIPEVYDPKSWEPLFAQAKEIVVEQGTDFYLNDQDNFEKIYELVPNINLPDGINQKVFEILIKRVIGSKKIQKMLLEQEVQINELLIQEEFTGYDLESMQEIFNNKFYSNLLLSKTINQSMEADTELRCEELPPYLENYFGIGLQKGKISVNKTGNQLGMLMSGGQIEASEAGDYAGEYMRGGVLKLGNCGNELGMFAPDGVIYVTGDVKSFGDTGGSTYKVVIIAESATSPSSPNSDAVTLVSKDYIDGLESRRDLGNNKYSYCTIYYNPEVNHYYRANTTKMAIDFIFDSSSLQEFKTKDTNNYGERANIGILNTPRIIDAAELSGMKKGLLICNDLPKGELGEGVTGGVIIINDLEKTPDEVRSQISKNRKPGDGLILMRVPDPENEGKTKLIDLEVS